MQKAILLLQKQFGSFKTGWMHSIRYQRGMDKAFKKNIPDLPAAKL